MVHKTGNNDPAPEQQNEHHPASNIHYLAQGLHDTETLKEKLKNIFDSNYQYYIKRKLKDRLIPANANKTIELNITKKANEITSSHLQSVQNISFQKIILYDLQYSHLLQRNHGYNNTQTRHKSKTIKTKMDCQP